MINPNLFFISLFATSAILISTADASEKKATSIESIDAVIIRDAITIGTQAPAGYYLDSSNAAAMGLCSLYIKSGKTFHDSPIIIYSRIANSNIKGEKGIETLVSEVMSTYKPISKVSLVKRPFYKSKSGMEFTVRRFLNGPPPNNFESAAYLEYKGGVLMSIMSAKTEKELLEGEAAFLDYLDRISPYSTEFPKGVGECMYPKKDQKK